MPVELKGFSGILNSDDSNEVMPPTHHKMAFNGVFRGNGNNMRFQNIPGTTLIDNSLLPTGNNQCIGSYFDQLKQRIIWFNYNSDSKHGIYQYNIKSGLVTGLLICFTHSTSDILHFSLDFPIPSVNILYTTDVDGDILHWTDRLNRPCKLNLLDAFNQLYGSNWLEEYITVARPMPLLAPICSYQNDNTVTINNLRRKLFEFRFRWAYKDLTTSCFSPYSKMFAPVNVDDLAIETDPQKNNRIDAIVNTGPADAVKIQIYARLCLGAEWSDNYLIDTIVKADQGLGNNIPYTYQFYNNGAYNPVDINQADELFDYVPLKANTQELLNGNVIIYGGITEGYDLGETLSVTSSVSLIDNNIAADPFQITVQDNQTFNAITGRWEGNFYIFMTGTPQAGDVYTITVVGNDSIFGTDTLPMTYTVLPGDVLATVEQYFRTTFTGSSFATNLNFNAGDQPEFKGFYIFTDSGTSHVITVNYTVTLFNPTPVGPVTDVNIACWKHKSRYAFVIIYFDEFGVTNGGNQNKYFFVETPEIDTTGGSQPKIPAIQFQVNNQPPIWASYFSWGRTNSLTFASLLTTVTADSQHDAASEFFYLNITNQQDNQNGFPSYSFSQGDRVRIIGVYTDPVNVIDLPIVDLLTDPMIDGGTVTGDFIKTAFSAGLLNSQHYYIEIYTPVLNTNIDLLTYFEFGEQYSVINPGTVNRAHSGQAQDQIVGTQPAIFNFVRGDFYIRERTLPREADLTININEWILDQSVSDLYPSKISGTGRPFVIDPFARQQYYMTLVRWSLSYQQDTNINQTNRFYGTNFDEYDRQKGDIQRFRALARILVVIQSRGVGQVGVYTKFIQDSGGTNTLTTTDNIITTNNISYYEGDYGCGDQYCGVAFGKYATYFNDPVRGYQVRLSRDGLVPISELYKGQFYIQTLLPPYNKNYLRPDGSRAKIISFYDFFEEQMHTILQAGTYTDTNNVTTTLPDYNWSFNEKRNAYCSFYTFFPEWITCAQDMTYSWLAGKLYIHNNTNGYCNFYDIGQQECSITLVFNDKVAVKKTFNAIAYQGNELTLWDSSTNGDILTSTINPQTGLPQISQLKRVDYEIMENIRYSAFLRDANSGVNPAVALLEGDFLKGNWTQCLLRNSDDSEATLFAPYVNYSVSQRNF